MSLDPRTPVIVGASQVTNRGPDLLEPIGLLERVARGALDDAGATSDLTARLTGVVVVDVLHRHAEEPAHRVADRIGAPPGWRARTTVGGNTPAWLITRLCDDIAAGRHEAVLFAGAETGDSARRGRAQGLKMDRSGDLGEPASGVDEVIGDSRQGVSDAEVAAGLIAPPHIYPLLESALAARDGRDLDDQRDWVGRVMAPFTDVAARHPDLAWFPQARSAGELSAVSAGNRLVAEPYTKLLNAMLRVDQAAAVVLTSAEVAEAAGVPRDRWVFPWAGADAYDVFLVSERPGLDRSEGIAAAARAVFEAAGIGPGDLTHIDLYSCFASAVQMGAEAVGLDVFDERGLTVTGGLPYFGGPGNNYTTHAVATLVDRLRDEPDGIGLSTGLGWYVTKHGVVLYSGSPPPNGWRHPETSPQQAAIDATALEVVTGADAEGEAVVEGFTVIHDREAGPATVPVIARRPDGRRVCAVVEDTSFAAGVSGGQLVGTRIRVARTPSSLTYELLA